MYTPQVSSVSQDSFSARESPRITAKRARQSLKSSVLLKSSFSASPGLHASRVIEETDGYALEALGSPLPVLVTEVLTSTDRCGELSIRVSPCGWAWLVSGRRLLVWRYAGAEPSRRVTLCRELTLPPSDLAHRAELVQVLGGSDTHVPGCLAASPEGALRFWPSIVHESSSSERSANLQGQECARLVCLGEAGCLLATTTSTLVLVSWRDGLRCRRLAAAAGLLGGLGRRMSSLIWGAMQAAGAEEPLVSLRACAESDGGGGRAAYLLTEKRLQRWWVDGTGSSDRVDFEVDLDRIARESFLQTVWNRDTTSADQLELELRDLWETPQGLLVLITAQNPLQSNTVFFALGLLEEVATGAPSQWARFDILRHMMTSEDMEGGQLQLLAAEDSLFVHDHRQIMCLSLAAPGESIDMVRLGTPRERIIGCGLAGDDTPLVFTSRHGLLRLTARRASAPAAAETSRADLSLLGFDPTSPLSQSCNMSMTHLDIEELASSDDAKARLRAAWVLFCQQDLARCSALVEEVFPRDTSPAVDSELDRTVVELSSDIIDDYPASDPRWAESAPHEAALSGAGSLILLHQLNEKRERHRLLLAFLRSTGLWSRLTGLTSPDALVATSEILQEHQEKIIAAMTLANQSKQLSAVVEAAVARVVEDRGEAPLRPLTTQDLFFRRLSALHELLPALLQLQQEQLQLGSDARQLQQLVAETNTVFTAVLSAVAAARQQMVETPPEAPPEQQPWSCAGAARPLLLRQYRLTLEHALPASEQGAPRSSLYQQLLELADAILGGYRLQLASIESSERRAAVQSCFEEDRYTLIRPLVEAGQYERACSLAEKYADFRSLVEICELTNSPERRDRYLTQFSEQGFAGFVFNWYLERGRRGELLSQCRRSELAGFLQEYRGLRWLSELEAGRYSSAADTLHHCAGAETEFLTRKKTYLSLSKLCALASSQGVELERRLEQLQPAMELVLLQEQLPATVLEAHGIDAETMHVLSPRELILLYVSPENVDANEFDFVRALELAASASLEAGEAEGEAETRQRLELEVWCRAVLRDDWADRDTDRPVASCSDTLLMRTVEMLRLSGRRAPLPPPEHLLACEELTELAADPGFTFLLRALHEHVTRLDATEGV